MSLLEILVMLIDVFLEGWKDRSDPGKARLRAAAAITARLSENHAEVRRAIVAKDGVALAAHFEALRDRSLELVGDKERKP